MSAKILSEETGTRGLLRKRKKDDFMSFSSTRIEQTQVQEMWSASLIPLLCETSLAIHGKLSKKSTIVI